MSAQPNLGMQPTQFENPMGIDGFEFVEFAAPDAALLHALFQRMGFTAVARHRSRELTLYRQGGVNFRAGKAVACINPKVCEGVSTDGRVARVPSDACGILKNCAKKHEEVNRDKNVIVLEKTARRRQSLHLLVVVPNARGTV